MKRSIDFSKLFRSGTILSLLLVLSFLGYGCAGVTGDGSEGESGAPVQSGALSATPGSIGFGNVATGSSATRTVTVSNTGSAALSVGNVSVSGAGFSVTGLSSGLSLPPGQSATATITFSPASTGAVTGQISIASAALPSPLVVALTGTGTSTSSHSVTLTWNASSASVVGYRAYRSASGGSYSMLNPTPTPQLRFTDSTVQPGTTYYYYVRGVSADGTESGNSNQATAVVPK